MVSDMEFSNTCTDWGFYDVVYLKPLKKYEMLILANTALTRIPMRPGQCTPIFPDPFCLSEFISQRYPAAITIVRTSAHKKK